MEESKMKALQFPGSREVFIKEFPDPKPGKDEVVIRMKASGICGSDLNYLYRIPKEEKDKYVLGVWVSSTVIPGHEPCGIVEEVGENVTHLKKGDRVIVYHISGCGVCKSCREGYYMHCKNKKTYGFDINGSFADFMVAKEKDCVLLPDELSFEEGCYYACGAGTAFKACKRLNISGLDTVSIFGLGPVGLAAVMFAKKFGGKVIAVDPIDVRRDIAKNIGADYVINPLEEDVVREIKKITDGEGTSVSIECSSNPTARSQILDSTKIWGKVAYVGEGKTVTIDVSNQIIHKHLTIFGSWVYTIPELMDLLNFAAKEKLNLPALITHQFTLDEAEEALKLADSGKSGKIVFKWD
jgi:propanol-preferring alcohol dehydrogenase